LITLHTFPEVLRFLFAHQHWNIILYFQPSTEIVNTILHLFS
jgi:hypothetical protein